MANDNDLEIVYTDMTKDINDIDKEIWNLEDNPYVKKYLELQEQRKKLDLLRRNTYKLIKYNKYKNCNHLWIVTRDSYDEYDYACFKCGLTKKVNRLVGRGKEDILTYDEKIMRKILETHNYKAGININAVCNLELASAIYRKIMEYNPDIDDKTAVKYLEIALDNIRNIEVSEERKMGRAKRLGLSKNFNRWSSSNV